MGEIICMLIGLGKLLRNKGIVVKVVRIMGLVGGKIGHRPLGRITQDKVGIVSSLKTLS